jgi:hypothetical protein
MDMRLVEWQVTGLSPLLQHNPASMGGGDAEQQIGKKVIPTPEVEAEAGTYRLPSGQLYIPSISFRNALLGACTGKRIGKVAAAGIVAGSVFVPYEQTPLIEPGTGEPITTWEVDVRRAVVMRQGIRRARPRIEKWGCLLTLEVDIDYIANLDILTQLLTQAGALKGVGDYRPEKKGMYGRFTVERVGGGA